MKRKNILSSLALLLTTAVLTSCAGTSQKVIFSSNWQNDNTVQQNDLTETLEYAVSFEKGSPLSDAYSLNYTNGIYTTSLKTEQYNGRTIYSYETNLTIDVIYEMNAESTQLQDTVYSLVKFEKTDKSLRPISSHKEVYSHSPSNGATELSKCYELFHYTVDISYNENYAGEAIIKNLANENATETKNSFSVNTEKYTCIDNEQLLFALRGVNPSLSSTAKFNVYSPFVKATQRIKATFASEEGADFNFVRNGVAVKEAIQYYPVSIVLEQKNSGATKTAWMAKSKDVQSNTYRNVILRLETPLSYSLGTLVYTLKSATFN